MSIRIPYAGRQTLMLVLIGAALVAVLSVLPRSTFSNTVSLTGYAWSDTTGWMSLNCSNTSSCGTSNYGLVVGSNGDITGYAWSDNIGWIQFGGLDTNTMPSGSGTQAQNAKISGNNMKGWAKALAGGSAGSGGWDGWISLSGAQYGPVQNGSGVFSGYAWGSTVVGWVDFSPAIGACTPANYCVDAGHNTGTGVTYNIIASLNSQCAVTYAPSPCAAPSFCSAGSAACLYPPVTYAPDDGHLTVRPAIVPALLTSNVRWNVSNVTSCTVTGTNGDSWTVAGNAGNAWTSTSGSAGKLTQPIADQTTYTLTCTGVDGRETVPESATVNIIPIFEEV